jgi:hypothetical protein
MLPTIDPFGKYLALAIEFRFRDWDLALEPFYNIQCNCI